MKFIFLGDSLMQENGPETYPQTGWPQKLNRYVALPNLPIHDYGKNGRSTKSFMDEGWFDMALKDAEPGDVVVIGFGHNDEKDDPKRHTDPNGSFQNNLVHMTLEMEKKGVKGVILATPITRLKFDDNGVLLHTHGEYPSAIKEVANRLKLYCIDLEAITYELLAKQTKKEQESHYMILEPNTYPNFKEGQVDTTHLKEDGAIWIAGLVAKEMSKIPYLKGIFQEEPSKEEIHHCA